MKKISRSERAFSRAKITNPGGVNSPVRSFKAVGGTPLFISHGKGSYIWDIDGNGYIDYLCSWGPLILGHANNKITDVITKQANLGTSFGSPTLQEIELSELICNAIPSIESVRLVNSGTEACMSAIRLARAFTKRNMVIKFNGCYHGHSDAVLVKAGSGALSKSIPISAGVPYLSASDTLVAEYNDLDTVDDLFNQYPDQIACVIVEPIGGNMGVIPPTEGFLEGIRKLTTKFGSLLIFDEVITGFRVSYGGAQELYRVAPDITCLGKIIGGGLPVGAYGASKHIMELVAPLGPMYQAGTLSGNPIAVSAGIATLKELSEKGTYQRLEYLTTRLTNGLKLAALDYGKSLTINQTGSMFTLFFADGPITNVTQAEKSATNLYSTFFHQMLKRGVYFAPSQFESGFLSTAHTEIDIDLTIEHARQSLGELSQ